MKSVGFSCSEIGVVVTLMVERETWDGALSAPGLRGSHSKAIAVITTKTALEQIAAGLGNRCNTAGLAGLQHGVSFVQALLA